MQRSYLDYAMSVIVSRALRTCGTGSSPSTAACSTRCTTAGTGRPRVLQVRPRRRRRHGSLPPARGHLDLRRPRPARPGLVAALPARRRPGELRFARERPGGGPPVHRVPHGPAGHGDGPGHRRGDRRLLPNYDGHTTEPDVLPSRFPNLLVNGSAGIAVGMATNIPPHNLREVADGAKWLLDNPDASDDGTARGPAAAHQGPRLPTGAQILGQRGIADAYRTGRGRSPCVPS